MAFEGHADWEMWFWAVFAASRNPMAIVDGERRIMSANESMQKLLGHAEEQLAGRPFDELWRATGTMSPDERWRSMLARGGGHTSVMVGDGRRPVAAAEHVAHVGGRLAVLIVLTPEDGAEGEPAEEAATAGPLTPRELEIVGLLAMGATSKEIAADLHVTHETVRTHVRNAMAKTGTRTRAHLVAASLCRGFLPAISST